MSAQTKDFNEPVQVVAFRTFHDEIRSYEEKIKQFPPEATEHSQRKEKEASFKDCTDPAASLVFYTRSLVEILAKGSMTEKEIRQSLSQVCRVMGVKATGRGTISGLNIDIPMMCHMLACFGVLEQDLVAAIPPPTSVSQHAASQYQLSQHQHSVSQHQHQGSQHQHQGSLHQHQVPHSLSSSYLLVKNGASNNSNGTSSNVDSTASNSSARSDRVGEDVVALEAQVMQASSEASGAAPTIDSKPDERNAARLFAALSVRWREKLDRLHCDALISAYQAPLAPALPPAMASAQPQTTAQTVGGTLPLSSGGLHGSSPGKSPMNPLSLSSLPRPLSLKSYTSTVTAAVSSDTATASSCVANGPNQSIIATADIVSHEDNQPQTETAGKKAAPVVGSSLPLSLFAPVLPVDPLFHPSPTTAADSWVGGAQCVANTPSSSTSLLNGTAAVASIRSTKRAVNQRVWRLQSHLDSLMAPEALLSTLAQRAYEVRAAEENEEALVRRLCGQCGIALPAQQYRAGTGYLQCLRTTCGEGVELADTRAPSPATARLSLRDGAVLNGVDLWERGRAHYVRRRLRRRGLTVDSDASTQSDLYRSLAAGYPLPHPATVAEASSSSSSTKLRRSNSNSSNPGVLHDLDSGFLSAPSQLQPDEDWSAPLPFAGPIYAAPPQATPPSSYGNLAVLAGLGQAPHTYVRRDIALRTAALPWRQVALEFREADVNGDEAGSAWGLADAPSVGSASSSHGQSHPSAQNQSSSPRPYKWVTAGLPPGSAGESSGLTRQLSDISVETVRSTFALLVGTAPYGSGSATACPQVGSLKRVASSLSRSPSPSLLFPSAGDAEGGSVKRQRPPAVSSGSSPTAVRLATVDVPAPRFSEVAPFHRGAVQGMPADGSTVKMEEEEEDTSDEVMLARHDRVLVDMRDQWAQLHALRLELQPPGATAPHTHGHHGHKKYGHHHSHGHGHSQHQSHTRALLPTGSSSRPGDIAAHLGERNAYAMDQDATTLTPVPPITSPSAAGLHPVTLEKSECSVPHFPSMEAGAGTVVTVEKEVVAKRGRGRPPKVQSQFATVSVHLSVPGHTSKTAQGVVQNASPRSPRVSHSAHVPENKPVTAVPYSRTRDLPKSPALSSRDYELRQKGYKVSDVDFLREEKASRTVSSPLYSPSLLANNIQIIAAASSPKTPSLASPPSEAGKQ